MNNITTLEKLNRMKLYGMSSAFKQTMEIGGQTNFTPDELIAHLVDMEWEDRYNRRLKRLIKSAKFREQAAIPQIDFISKRNLDKNLILRLAECLWLEKNKSIIITGPTGSGKSFIASALGNQACIKGYKVKYFNCQKLFPLLKMQKADGSYFKEIEKIAKQDLLIIDDFGLKTFDDQERLMLLEILEDRYGTRSTIFVSQLPISNWHEIIGEPTIADAICDRLVHSSYKIKLKGGSMRIKNKNN